MKTTVIEKRKILTNLVEFFKQQDNGFRNASFAQKLVVQESIVELAASASLRHEGVCNGKVVGKYGELCACVRACRGCA